MNSEKTSELTVQTLMALRKDNDAVRVITERLEVKKMGPADHIRTKHEAKAFLESGGESAAEALLQRAAQRRDVAQIHALRTTQNRSQRITE